MGRTIAPTNVDAITIADRSRSMRQIAIRLDDNDGERVEQLAHLDGRSISNYVQRVVKRHLDETKNIGTD